MVGGGGRWGKVIVVKFRNVIERLHGSLHPETCERLPPKPRGSRTIVWSYHRHNFATVSIEMSADCGQISWRGKLGGAGGGGSAAQVWRLTHVWIATPLIFPGVYRGWSSWMNAAHGTAG